MLLASAPFYIFVLWTVLRTTCIASGANNCCWCLLFVVYFCCSCVPTAMPQVLPAALVGTFYLFLLCGRSCVPPATPQVVWILLLSARPPSFCGCGQSCESLAMPQVLTTAVVVSFCSQFVPVACPAFHQQCCRCYTAASAHFKIKCSLRIQVCHLHYCIWL